MIPDAELTPGAINPCVHAVDICEKGATTKDRRGTPPTKEVLAVYNTHLKFSKDQDYQDVILNSPELPGLTIAGKTEARQEIDHLISLQLGGADDVLNLWPQPAQHPVAGAHDKDKIEDKGKEEMCRILKEKGEAAANEYLALIQRVLMGGFKRDRRGVGVASRNAINWYDLYHEAALPHLNQCARYGP